MSRKDNKAKLLRQIANRVRLERKKANLSMDQLAELANVSAQTIKDIEYAKRACRIDTFASIAAALDVGADALLGFASPAELMDITDFNTLYSQLNNNQKKFLLEVTRSMSALL